MTIEQAILEKVRSLPPEKQQEILDFAEFLVQKSDENHERNSEISTAQNPSHLEPAAYIPKTPLGKRLRELRAQIVVSGERLLTAEEIEQEIADQRERLRDFEQ